MTSGRKRVIFSSRRRSWFTRWLRPVTLGREEAGEAILGASQSIKP